MKNNEDLIAAIDIGTTKITTLVGNLKKNNTIEVIGYGNTPCRGVKKGLIVDINEASKSILSSVEEAEKTSKTYIDNAFIGVTGKHVSFLNNWSEVQINSANKVIRRTDVDKLISLANKVHIPSQYEIIHTLIKQFSIEDEKGIVDPVGLSADKLAVELFVIYGSTSLIKNVANSVQACNIGVEDIILEALASSEAVLTQDEKESGVILLDIGGGTTDVAVYKNKKMAFTYCLPVGGDLITNDISVGLNIPVSKAENIKLKYANVDYDFYETLNKVNISDIKIDRNKTTLNIRLYNIVNSRVKELLELIKEKIESYGHINSSPCGIVLTGGTSQLRGMISLAQSVFNMPVRQGIPIDVEGPSEVVKNPIYSTSTGILKYAFQIKKFMDPNQGARKSSRGDGIMSRFRDFISRILRND